MVKLEGHAAVYLQCLEYGTLAQRFPDLMVWCEQTPYSTLLSWQCMLWPSLFPLLVLPTLIAVGSVWRAGCEASRFEFFRVALAWLGSLSESCG